MRESFAPHRDTVPPVGGLADTVYENAEKSPDFVALERKTSGRWQEVNAARFREEVLALAKGLLAHGIRFGDRVGIMSRTRYEWTLFDYALWSVGAEPVPVYPTSSPEQVREILAQARVVACLVENDSHVMTLGSVIGGLPDLTRIWQIDAGVVDELTAAGAAVPDKVVHRHRLAVTPQSVATVVYTPGTTGRPKGCVLTHGSLMTRADSMLARFAPLLANESDGSPPSTLLFLPLAHILGRTAQVAALRGGVRLAHQPAMSASALLPDLAAFRPTFILAVPSVFEEAFAAVQRVVENEGDGEFFERAVDIAVRFAEAEERRVFGDGPGPGASLRVRHRLCDKRVYSRIRDLFGGRMRNALSGGSALGRRLGLFFAGAGIMIHEGYGLTESCSGATCNPPGRVRFGTVGSAVDGVDLRIAGDGEILLRGAQLFRSYLGDPPAVPRVPDGVWLSTGDLGSLDGNGYLTVTGRKQDIIVTSGGKRVSPALLEDEVRAHPLVAQCVLFGDNRPYIAALITLDPEALGHWLAARGRPRHDDPAELLRDRLLEAEIRQAIDAANSRASKAGAIRVFRVLPEPFGVESGLLTPLLGPKRAEVARAYAEEIESLYER